MDTSFVDQHLFPWLLRTATLLMMERSSSPHGPKKISEPEERDGGTKPLMYQLENVLAQHTVCAGCGLRSQTETR